MKRATPPKWPTSRMHSPSSPQSSSFMQVRSNLISPPQCFLPVSRCVRGSWMRKQGCRRAASSINAAMTVTRPHPLCRQSLSTCGGERRSGARRTETMTTPTARWPSQPLSCASISASLAWASPSWPTTPRSWHGCPCPPRSSHDKRTPKQTNKQTLTVGDPYVHLIGPSTDPSTDPVHLYTVHKVVVYLYRE